MQLILIWKWFQKKAITVPRHKRVNPYTLKAIIKDAGLTDKDFKSLL
ncbi:MAG: type II toxin-antitoxin system HicA family toxin [Candidatus Omnitrophica bacterium]|nr:type II toxin-antitoxin system HicA family toxin [Candidatus Omnitrophota bacterium]